MFSRGSSTRESTRLKTEGLLVQIRPAAYLGRAMAEQQFFDIVFSLILGSLAVTCIFYLPFVSRDLPLLASLASTVYMIFLFPENPAVDMKRICISYFLSSFSGIFIASLSLPFSVSVFFSVFLAMLLMSITKQGHPPAAGVALSAVLNETVSLDSIFAVMIAVVFLCVLLWIIAWLSVMMRKEKHLLARYIQRITKNIVNL